MRRTALSVILTLFLTGCAGHQQSTIDPAGPQSGKIDTLWWSFFWLLGAIYIAVMVVLLYALMRPRGGAEQERIESVHKPSDERDSRVRRIVTGATLATIAILFVLIV